MNFDKPLPILHIGYPKTATTWFQNEFFPKISGIEYFNRKRNMDTLGTKWRDIQVNKNTINLFNVSDKRIIVSDESMIGNNTWIEQNARNLKEIFYPAQIIIFIRNQIDKYVSNYSQYIKSGGTARFEDYLFDDSKKIFKGEKHIYDKLISIYKKYFGVSNVYVYLYEDFNENFDCFMNDFCNNHYLHLDMQIVRKKRINVSLSPFLLNLKRICNFFTRHQPYEIDLYNKQQLKYYFHIPYWYQFSNIIFEILNNFSGNQKFSMEELIGKEKTQIVKDYFSPSNNRLISEHGLRKIKDYNYPL